MLIEGKKPYHVQLFSGVEHGFALRGNQNDSYERKSGRPDAFSEAASSLTITNDNPGWVKEQSLRAIADWFDLWLARLSPTK